MSTTQISVNAGLNVNTPVPSPCDGIVTPSIPSFAIASACPLLSAAKDVLYSNQLEASGGTEPYYWDLISGSLPVGLTLSTAGLISGTPTVIGTSSFTLRAVALLGGTVTKSCQLSVAGVVITTTCPLDDGALNAAYSNQMQATGGTLPYTWSISAGSLPTGLSLATNGIISGTPTVAEVKTFTLHVVDAAANVASKSCQLTIVNLSAINFTDDWNIPDTSGPPYNQIGPKWGVTVDANPAPANGILISSHKAGFFYISGNGSGYIGCVADVTTYGVLGAPHALLGDADWLSEGTLFSDSSNVGVPLLTRGGPAGMLSGSAVSHGLACYVAAYCKDSAGISLRRVVLTANTTLGTTVACVVGDRITLTGQDIGTAMRLKVYINGVLGLTYDDTSASRVTTGGLGLMVFFCSSGVGSGWDDWACCKKA